MDSPSHLSVVIDLHPSLWHRSALGPPTNTHSLSLALFLSHLLVFLNAHVAAKDENTLAVFGAFPGTSRMLYSSTDSDSLAHDGPIDPNTYPPFKLLDATVTARITECLDALADTDVDPILRGVVLEPSALVGAITKALCHINRISIPTSSIPSKPAGPAAERDPSVLPDPRLLILSVSPDLATSYIPIMNSVFSAQKLKVTIDVCQLYGPDTVFLQQAAHLTGGSYINLFERRDALLQYLIMAFLPPPAIRKILAVPTQDKVDFRAACFCHKNIVDVGFVCSVCLSIFCQPVPVCSTCRTKFPMKTLQRLNQSRPVLLSSTSNPSTPNAPGTPRAAPSPSTNPNPNGTSALARSVSTSAAAAAVTQPTIGSGELPHSSSIGRTPVTSVPNGTMARSISHGSQSTPTQ